MSQPEVIHPIRPQKLDLAQAAKAKSGGLHEALQQMGYPGLREVQKIPVENILCGRDIIVVAPTSAGKSAMFAIPTLALGWKTLVFSPLVALMRDQVFELQHRGVAADFINSLQTPEANSQAINNWAMGKTQILYVAPERLASAEFHAAMTQVPPNMVTIDEVHCLSQWADNFRSIYCRIGDFIADYKPNVVSAFTATCTAEIEDDVCRVLGLPKVCTLWQYYRRENLTLQSRELEGGYDIVRDLEEHEGKSIIYFSTIKRLTEFAPWLEGQLNMPIGVFYGDLQPDLKTHLQDAFKSGDVQVMCATNAFGLGVNITDIRSVIHHDPPGTPEALFQELGRAGRDDAPAQCITYHHTAGWRTQQNFIESGNPEERLVRQVYNTLLNLGGDGSVIKKTGNEIADMAGVTRFCIQPVMEILKGSNIVQSANVTDRIAKVSFTGNSEDDRFRQYKDLIIKGGLETNSSFVDINLDWLRQQIGATENTVTRWLKQWAIDGLIEYVAPFRGQPRVLVGDITRVDFDRLKAKRQLAWEKLKSVQDYMDIPDREKHDFLEEYFAKWDKVG